MNKHLNQRAEHTIKMCPCCGSREIEIVARKPGKIMAWHDMAVHIYVQCDQGHIMYIEMLECDLVDVEASV